MLPAPLLAGATPRGKAERGDRLGFKPLWTSDLQEELPVATGNVQCAARRAIRAQLQCEIHRCYHLPLLAAKKITVFLQISRGLSQCS